MIDPEFSLPRTERYYTLPVMEDDVLGNHLADNPPPEEPSPQPNQTDSPDTEGGEQTNKNMDFDESQLTPEEVRPNDYKRGYPGYFTRYLGRRFTEESDNGASEPNGYLPTIFSKLGGLVARKEHKPTPIPGLPNFDGSGSEESPLIYKMGEQVHNEDDAEKIRTSREYFEEYFDLRDSARNVNKISGQELTNIQANVATWLDENEHVSLPQTLEQAREHYTSYSEELVFNKILGLCSYLEENYADTIDKSEIEATRIFVHSTIAMYKDSIGQEKLPDDADGSFAFIVPTRTGRHHPEYGDEIDPVIPAFRYVPNELRTQMMVGLPPFVIDRYQVNESGRRGYLILAPVFEDMGEDIDSLSAASCAAIKIVNDAVNFAHGRFGVQVVGLGATLPAITRYGQKIENPNVITTSGHSGTVELIKQTVEEHFSDNEPKSIGILGLGAIGEAIARIISDRYPNAQMHVYDVREKRTEKVAEQLRNAVAAKNDADVLRASEIVISAITSKLDLNALGLTKEDLEGTLIIDDSQPGSIDEKQARELGAINLWVIGEDSSGKVAARSGYDYGTMHNANTDIFGCEAEAAVISRYLEECRSKGISEAEILARGKELALNKAVDAQHVKGISNLFAKYGIRPARPQAYGRLVDISKHK
jgi:hypothetical protein